MNSIRPTGSTVFNCHNPKGVKLVTRLRLGLNYLREHKFKHRVQDSLNPICSCGNDIETSAHFLLHYPDFSNERSAFLNIIGSIDRNILTRSYSQVTETLLYGDSNSNNITNTLILNATIDFLVTTKRFDVPLIEYGLIVSLIYINDLSDNLQCNPKLFADDMSLFSTVKLPERTANNLNNDLKEINK